MQARLNKGKLLEAMAIFFERYLSSFSHMDSLCKMLIGIFNRYCRSSRSGNDELHAMGVVRRCGLCQESDMVLRKNRVCVFGSCGSLPREWFHLINRVWSFNVDFFILLMWFIRWWQFWELNKWLNLVPFMFNSISSYSG